MRTILFFVLILMISGLNYAQQNTCFTANPFCSSQQYNFPNATSGSAPSGPNYGCLSTRPRPIWYYMEVGTSGTIDMILQQTTQPNGAGSTIDVDFAMWGPFSDLNSGCNTIMSGSVAPIQCSYSPSYSEDIGLGVSGGTGSGASTPPAAVAGQVYIILLTNYNGSAGYITFNQIGGTGSADCSIVEPCSITGLTGTTSACDPATNTYSLNGTVTFENAPETGQLIAETCDGTQLVLGSAPFTTSSLNYSFTGLPATGGACDVYVYFTAEDCSQLLTYTAPQCPPNCAFNSIDGTVGVCQQGSIFTLTGTVEFSDPPSTGQLVIQECGGGSVTFNPPFVSPLNFTISDIDANGSACSVTATFTADPSCTITLNYTNTPPCDCTVAVGNFTTTTAGESNSTYVLCYGDEILIESSGGFIPPPEATNPPLAEGYEPGLGWMVYSCPPTVGLVPNTANGLEDDPCLIGFFSGDDLYDVNDQFWIDNFPAGTFTNNTVYFVPVTMYNLSEGTYSYVNSNFPCYETGTPYSIQYLPEITTTVVPDCQTGTVSVTVQGGAPAVNGSNFTGSNLTPASATFNTASAPNNGTIVVGGLQDGDNYSFEITDQYGCPVTITGTFQGVNSSDFTYPQAAYCKDAANPTPTITGVTGGTFSGTTGLSINATTGVIDLAATASGTYTVTYTSPGTSCNSSSTFEITINDLPVISAQPASYCEGQSATLTASGASTYEWSPSTGLSATTGASVISSVTSNQTYTITGTSAAGCIATGTVTVTVNPNPTPVIQGPTEYCSGSTATLSTTETYTTYTWSNGQTGATTNVTTANNPTTVTVTNEFGCSATSDPFTVVESAVLTVNTSITICQGESAVIHGQTQTAAGTYSNTAQSVNGCDSVSNVTLIVNPLPIINAGNDVSVCAGQQVTLNATGAPQIVWSNGISNNVPFTQPAGTVVYTATGTDANGCTNTDQVSVTVNSPVQVDAGPNQFICIGEQVTLTATPNTSPSTSYAWTNGVQQGVAFAPSTSNSYTVVYTDENGCTSTDIVDVIVNNLPTIVAGPNLSGCFGDVFTVVGSGAGVGGTYTWTNGVLNGVPFAPPIGTTVYTVTGTDANGCSNTSTLEAKIDPVPNPNFYVELDQNCAPAVAVFYNTTVEAHSGCVWYFDDGTVVSGCGPITHGFSHAGVYGVRLQVGSANNFCQNDIYIDSAVIIDAKPNAQFTYNPIEPTVINSQVFFTNESVGAVTYDWDFGDGVGISHAVNPDYVYPDSPGLYVVTLVAYSLGGCPDTTKAVIPIKEDLIFYVPNTFTPDSDQYNETFMPIFAYGFDPYDYTMIIYNRWGEMIFETHDVNVGWSGTYGVDGAICQDGTYTWKIEVKTSMSDERRMFVGHVSLIR